MTSETPPTSDVEGSVLCFSARRRASVRVRWALCLQL